MSHHIYACLPFVELGHEITISMGPILFWPASKVDLFVEEQNKHCFFQYIEEMTHVKTTSQDNLINTTKLALDATTCVSIDSKIPEAARESLLIDSLYLLYFACTFRNLYYNSEILPFDSFRKFFPASIDFIEKESNWKGCYIKESDREETVCISLVDPEIATVIGKILSSIYSEKTELNREEIDHYKRLIRAVRYLVDRFFERFVNLFGHELKVSDSMFEPEDVIFLSSSFEALFNLDEKHTLSDFKHKVRPILHLNYSTPLELFWKWAEDYYAIRHKIVHAGDTPDSRFRHNPNFEVSHIVLGIKLFIYSFYYTLYKDHLMQSKGNDQYIAPDFRWIHADEVLLFFWTETSILNKLDRFLKELIVKQGGQELCEEIVQMMSLFLSMYERYYKNPEHYGIRFIPSPKEDFKEYAKEIFSSLKSVHLSEEKEIKEFVNALNDRLGE